MCSDIVGHLGDSGLRGDYSNLVDQCWKDNGGPFYGGTFVHILNWGNKDPCGTLTLTQD